MALYTLNGSEPAPIPFRIVMPDGFTRTDPSSFTAAEIAAAGYIEASAAPDHDPETHHAPAWDGAQWVVEPFSPDELAARFEQRKADMQEAIRARRWECETGGTTIDDIAVRTDEQSQTKIAGAIALFDKHPELASIDFEPAPGVWVTLDAATMTAIGVGVGLHIQACFTRARQLSEAVSAASDHAELDAIEINAGWPS